MVEARWWLLGKMIIFKFLQLKSSKLNTLWGNYTDLFVLRKRQKETSILELPTNNGHKDEHKHTYTISHLHGHRKKFIYLPSVVKPKHQQPWVPWVKSKTNNNNNNNCVTSFRNTVIKSNYNNYLPRNVADDGQDVCQPAENIRVMTTTTMMMMRFLCRQMFVCFS